MSETPQHEAPRTPEELRAEAEQMQVFAAEVAHDGLAKVYTTQAELLRSAADGKTKAEDSPN